MYCLGPALVGANATSLAVILIPPGISIIIFPADTGIGTVDITQAALYAFG
jgi:hypothetical protein